MQKHGFLQHRENLEDTDGDTDVLIDLKIIIPFKDIARQEIYSTQVAAEGARLTGSFSFALWKNTC